MRIIPVLPDDRTDDASSDIDRDDAPFAAATGGTSWRRQPSRRTFARRPPSRRTFGRKFPSRRTFGRRVP